MVNHIYWFIQALQLYKTLHDLTNIVYGSINLEKHIKQLSLYKNISNILNISLFIKLHLDSDF